VSAVITVAPTGSIASKADNRELPTQPEEIAEAGHQAYLAGASVAHIHLRDHRDQPTADLNIARRTMDLIAGRCQFIFDPWRRLVRRAWAHRTRRACGASNDEQCLATLHRAVELGVTLFDTAEVYGPHHNEQLVGRGLVEVRDKVVADVHDEDAVRHAVETAAGATGRLDVAVNSAGIDGGNDSHPFIDYPVQTLDLMLATNVRGMSFSMKHELAIMAAQGFGSIVNISSGAGLTGVPGYAGCSSTSSVPVWSTPR
jgi:NAD(P)-dependent dehydrogenase (short-subunit alcohol dehydrogenase family)